MISEDAIINWLREFLPPLADDVELAVLPDGDHRWVIAMGKKSLPWRERFVFGVLGTWLVNEAECREMIESFAQNVLIAGGAPKGFFKEGQTEPDPLTGDEIVAVRRLLSAS